MKLNDALWGALIAVLGTTVLIYVQRFPEMPGQRYGPAVFPGIIAGGFILCGLLLIVRGVRAHQPLAALLPWVRSSKHVWQFVAVVAAMVFYILASETLGFLLTAVLLLFALFVVFGVGVGRALILAIVFSFVIHLLFYKVMRVPLPWGWLTPLAW